MKKGYLFIFLLILSMLLMVSCIEDTNTLKETYTITFKLEDGTVHKTITYEEGSNLVLDTLQKNGYTFSGWYNESGTKITDGSSIKANIVLIGKFAINSYSYKFLVNGEIVKEMVAEYGSTIVYPEDPSPDGYKKFLGWDNDATILLKDEVFNAKFSDEKPQYTYKFVSEGTTLKEEKVEYGTLPVAPEAPTKEETAEYKYVFKGWDKEITEVTEDVVYTAVFEEVKQQYTYKFASEAPTKEETAEYKYVFKGWDKEITEVTEDVVYTAVFEEVKQQYTYKFVSEGTTLKEEKVEYGTLPVAPEAPTKEETAEYKYVFKGWDKEITEVTEDVVYTAVFEETAKSKLFTTLEGKTLSILGDSISTFYSATSPVNSYYSGENQYYYPLYSSTIKTVDLTWWYKLYTNTSMKLGVNNSWSGSCAVGTGDSAGNSDARINTIDDNGKPDIVIIYLGTNDCCGNYTLSEYSSAIKTMISKVRNLVGDPQIYLTTLGYSAYTGAKYQDSTRLAYNEELRKIAKEQECGIVPLDEYIVEDNYMIYLGDNLHYNAKGALLLSKIYEKAIKDYNGIVFNEDIEVEHKEQLPEGVLATVTATTNSNFWGNYTNGIFLFESANATIAQFSLRIEITKNTNNGKYYVTKVYQDGEAAPKHSGDYVLIISESHTDFTALNDMLKVIPVGAVVEFDENISFPVTLTFKEGDGNGPTIQEPEPDEKDPIITEDGKLHIGAYNTGIWTVYEEAAIVYSYDAIDKTSTFINFYMIKLTKDTTTGNYKIIGLKNVDVKEDFATCDYYVLIYRSLEAKSFYENAKIGDEVIASAEFSSGDCDLTF